MKQISNFKNTYSLSKTLRFELKPIGKTLEHIQTKEFLQKDANRAKSYQEVKKLIDRYHQHFIELALDSLKLTQLEEFQNLYLATAEVKKEVDFIKKFEKIQDDLRKEIVGGFKTGEANEIFKVLDKKELITELMVNWLSSKEEKDKVEEFKTFTTYFTGFHKNRKNMYTDEAQSTAIAYRLVHENLPKFLDNIKVFDKLKAVPELHEKCSVLYKEIEEYLNLHSIDEAFELDYFNMVLTQKQIEVYNLIIGGRTPKENEKKIQGLNEYINLYNQKQQDKKNKIPKLKPLYKMILSDRESVSFLAEKFDNSQEVLNAIKEYYHANLISYPSSEKDDTENVLERVKDLLANLSSNNLFQIYIRNGKAITDISQALFGDFSLIKDALKANFEKTLPEPKGKSKDTRPEKIEKYLKQDYFTIAEIETALWNYRTENDLLKDLKEEQHLIANYFNTHFKTKVNDKEYDLVANVTAKYSCIKGLLEQDYPEDKKLNQETKEIDDIKAFLDALMLVLHFVKPLMLPNDSTLEKDQSFYNTIAPYYEQLQHLVSLYNKVRNFASQKAYSVEKIKLNFGIGHFFNGWGSNYDTKSCLVIIKNGQYYLLIVDKKLSKDDLDFLTKKPEEHLATRVIYDFQKPDNKNIPRLFIRSKGDNFAPAVMKYNLPIDKVIDIYDNGLFKTDYRSKNPIHFKECLIKLIDYFKLGFENHESYKHYKFSWKKSQDYNDIAEFYKDVESSCYKLDFEEINFNHLLELISQKKGYLFQIYNKDFSKYSKGKPNMHTLYWKSLFDPENLKDVVYKLNGQAEIFYRKSSIKKDKVIVHKANEKVVNKNPLNTKKESLFSYDLVKDKRFTLDKFQFHVPITLNFKASGNDYINHDVLAFLRQNPDVNIIGLDRGERHLIYLTLINQKGEILRQFSLNEIVNEHNGITYKTGYKDLLDKKETERAAARENWGTIENIKELKEGYISQVVHKIAKMMVEYNAIVVMEDLNMGFKRGRFKVEKQVYQKLEKMLIDKLNYLVFKDKAPNEAGGLYNALQLANKFESFQKMGKQSGFLFYVPAWNTSKIDPTTGFVNLFYAKYESEEKAQKFFDSFDSIRFNTAEKYFEFAFDYNQFTERADGTKTQWTVCTNGNRILTFRNPETNNQWDNKEVNLTEQLEDLFGQHNISYDDGACIKAQIVALKSKEFLKALMDLFRLTLQMRNSITNSEVDYLISPVKNEQGAFYDSRKANDTLPKDADANGAFHIAQKGLMWLHQIHEFEGEDWKKLDLDKTNKGWLQFVQKF